MLSAELPPAGQADLSDSPPREAAVPPGWAQADNIALKARLHLGKSYSWLGVIASKLIPQTEPNPDRLYCSTYVGLVVAQGSGRTLASMPRHKPLHPGTLAGHAGLDRVDLEWRPI